MRVARPSEPTSDPFQERERPRFQVQLQLLGGRFSFGTDSQRLMRVVRDAFDQLPAHRFVSRAPHFTVKLVLAAAKTRSAQSDPPLIRPTAGVSILCGAMETASFAALSAEQREALIHVSADMLRFPYHIRYELLEFAVYTLAARAQELVALHGACIGASGRGVLLLGASGAGKSTLALHCLMRGLDFLAEDSVLVEPDAMLATGLANFLHIRTDSLPLFDTPRVVAMLRNSQVIRRRSGIEKFEIDLRRPPFHLAQRPLKIAAVVFVSANRAGTGPMLKTLQPEVLAQRLSASQRYAASQQGWRTFLRRATRLPAFELRRGHRPDESVDALAQLLLGAVPRPATYSRTAK